MSDTKFSHEYQEYLKTLDWMIKRRSAIERADHRCQVCGMFPKQGTTLQVHHKTYTNLGHESFDDLLVVCEDCHNKKHSDKDDAQHQRMMTFAEHYIPGYKSMSEESIRIQYKSFLKGKMKGRR